MHYVVSSEGILTQYCLSEQRSTHPNPASAIGLGFVTITLEMGQHK